MPTAPSLLESVLLQPPAAITYVAGTRLREMFPGKAVVECAGCGFDLDGFAEAGKAAVAALDDLGRSQTIYTWRGCENEPRTSPWLAGETGLGRRIGNAYLRVEWQGKTLHALQVRWQEMMAPQQAWFLIAETTALAEAFYTAVCEWSGVPHGEVLIFEQGNWRKDRALFAAIQSATFENLVLAPGVKESLQTDVAQFFARREVYTQYGVPWKRGVLLVGPPGNGKTHAVKALCHELGVPALYVRSLEPMGMFHGSEHANISSVFEVARKTAPCLLILEDLDALIKAGNRSFLLNELDGFAANEGVCVVATTNFPERLDPSIMDRPSRFDRKYEFNLPASGERRRYLEMWNDQQTAELRLSENGLGSIVELTDGFSFAYLKELCLAAVMAWMNADANGSMDAIARAQADALTSQIKNQPDESEPSAPPSRRERFRKLLDGEQ